MVVDFLRKKQEDRIGKNLNIVKVSVNSFPDIDYKGWNGNDGGHKDKKE